MRIAIVELKLSYVFSPLSWEDREIIAINVLACDLLYEGLTVLQGYQTYVRPTIRPVLTKACIDSTSVEQFDVERANTLETVLPELNNWLERFNVENWCSWGNGKSQFIIECRIKSLHNVMKTFQFFDLHRIFSQVFGMRVDLNRALDARDLGNEASPSLDCDEKNNIARLLAKEETLRSAILTQVKKRVSHAPILSERM